MDQHVITEKLLLASEPVVFHKGNIQRLRFYSQIFSAIINVWIGVEFYLFVRFLETGGATGWVARPPGVDAWLPIGSMLSVRYWLETGIINDIHPAGLIIFMVILLTAFLFKKGFCSWVCPIGFISELFGDISDKIWKRRIIPPRWLDYPLRSLKYILLGLFIWAVLIDLSPRGAKMFIYSEYNQVADILMLRFFAGITMFTLTVIVILVLLSFVVRGFWCRYFCPYGALLGLAGMFSSTRIKRNELTCINCSSCANACPSFIAVDRLKEVRSDECTACMACVDACPVSNTLEIKTFKRKSPLPKIAWAAVLLLFFWGTLFGAKLFGPWQNNITRSEYLHHMQKIKTGEYYHP